MFKKWVSVAALDGTGDMRGPVFQLGDNKTRLVYTVTPAEQFPEMRNLVVYVWPEPPNPDLHYVWEVDSSESGTESIERPPGNYYLDVKAVNCGWSVSVQQKR